MYTSTKSLADIKAPIDGELKAFQQYFKEAMRSKVPLLDRVTGYIIRSKGKQVRPMFVFLCTRLFGETKPAAYEAAALVELLHTATLVHDDVVDDSLERRGFFSISALWKNKIAVLVGDYLLSQGLLIALKNKQYRLLELLSEAVQEMSEGELLQLEKARRLDISEEVYYNIIRQKTASLIASACASGTAAATNDEETILKMKSFGEKIGIAFQIRDDLFDFGDGDAGKPQGNDLKEKKMTLPLIYALNKADKATRRGIIYNIKNNNKNPEKIKEISQYVIASGGIEYAREAMYRYRAEAFDILHEFPDSEIRQALEDLVVFVTERNA